MTIPAIILTTIVCLGLAALIVCALIGLMAMGHFFNVNRRPVDDMPPVSWIHKQEGRE